MTDIPRFELSNPDIMHRTDFPRLTGRASISLYSHEMLKRKLITKKTFIEKYDDDIKFLSNCYDVVRANHEALGEKVISIGTYLFEDEGKLVFYSKYMSVCMRDGINDRLAENLGMVISVIEGKKYYQFPLKKDFSNAQKKAILNAIGANIAQKYDNDVVQYDEKIPSLYIMIDTKDFLEMVQKSGK